MSREKIVVLDFGSQYAHLIAKRFRLLGYYSEIMLPSVGIEMLESAKGIVMSGGPSSIYDKDIPEFNSKIMELDIPILGLCYGHYVVSQYYGGKIGKAPVGEFGFAQLRKPDCDNASKEPSPLFKNITLPTQVWMSHQDGILECAPGFEVVGSTKDCPFAAVQNIAKKRFSLQFHVEVKDTPEGNKIFANFAEYCGMEKNWDQSTVLNIILEQIKTQVAGRNVLLFLSGGVDSTVAFALLNKALGQEHVLGLHIDNGFMRKNESAQIAERYKKCGFTNFITEDASESFLSAIYKKTDPQQKRLAVGENFITVRDQVVAKQHLDESNWLLAQGTLYPDIIESGGTKNSKTIKTHHNRVAGIQALIAKGLIIEPLKDLYKDEVRNIGKKLGLNDELVMRHPFPGPGLSINVLCNNGIHSDADKVELSESKKELEAFFAPYKRKGSNELKAANISVLPVKSVGVQGDFRTYRFPAVLNFPGSQSSSLAAVGSQAAVSSQKTASSLASYQLPVLPEWKELEKTSSDITNGTKSVNRTIIALYTKDGSVLREGYCDKPRLDQTREVDSIVLDALHESDWYSKIFQHLTINLPYSATAGNCSIVLRPVVSEDVMTARFAHLDLNLLQKIVAKIAALGFVDNLYYDITNKPPATFGWE